MFYDLKSAGFDQVLRAINAGGTLDAMGTSFYSGGYTYTHVLNTKRGTRYRVSDWVVKACTGEGVLLVTPATRPLGATRPVTVQSREANRQHNCSAGVDFQDVPC